MKRQDKIIALEDRRTELENERDELQAIIDDEGTDQWDREDACVKYDNITAEIEQIWNELKDLGC